MMESDIKDKLERLETLCSSKSDSDDKKLQLAKEELIHKCNTVVSLPYSIYKQDVITMLYMVGCNLARNDLHQLAVKVFECAKACYSAISARKSSFLDTDEVILMKVLFEAGECWNKLNNINEALESYQSCLNLSFHCSDLLFEKKVNFSLSEMHSQTGMFAEAVVGYLRCLVILDDLVFNGMLTENELTKEKCDLHQKLAFSYLELNLFDEALKHAMFVHKTSFQPRPEVLKLIGNLFDKLENPDLALQFYFQCLSLMPNKDADLSSVINSILCLLIKVRQSAEALEYCHMLLKNGSDTKDEFNIYRASIHKGEILVMEGEIEEAQKEFNFAIKLAQTFPDEYYCECKAICKIAGTFSIEGRYMQALYECERALSLAQKSKSPFLAKEVKLEVALHSQHSTSEKELSSALVCLSDVIREKSGHFQDLVDQELKVSIAEQENFASYYKAVQVILHRLHHPKAAAAFVHWFHHCTLFKVWNVSMPPVADLTTSNENAMDEYSISFLRDDQLYLLISCCKYDILTIVLYQDNATSYLLSDRVVNIRKTINRIKFLLQLLQPTNDKAKFSLLYNTEQRTLPKTASQKSTVLPAPVEDAGDAGDRRSTPLLVNNEKPQDSGDHELGSEDALKELFDILMKPVVPSDVESDTSICVIADGYLAKVPFDQLKDSSTQKSIGESFNVFTMPCLLEQQFRIHHTKHSPERPADTSQSLRDEHLTQSLDNAKDLRSLTDIGVAKDLSGLVTSSATGINIMTSPRYITPHKRVQFPVKSCVFGSPMMPSKLRYENLVWEPKASLPGAEKECNKVAGYLKVIPITGLSATKERFFAEFAEATVMHIATYGDVSKGVLAVTPNSFPVEEPPFPSMSYLVTRQELLDHKPNHLELVVLSSGHGWTHTNDVKLPDVFLAAGVSCVVYSKWPVPDCVAEKFFFYFYMNLQNSCKVSRALFSAKQATRERYPGYSLWNAFAATGCDVTIDLSKIRQSQLQSRLNEVELPSLDTPDYVDEVVSQEERFHQVQRALSRLSGSVSGDSDVISFLLGLVEEAIERLTSDDNADRPIVVIPAAVEKVGGSVDLLSLMGFDFQPIKHKSLPSTSGPSSAANKMIVFPHWNQDSLLIPCHQALIGLHELCQSPDSLRTMALMLPLEQNVLSYLIDLLSILHHTPEVRLRTTDSSVKELWNQTSIRSFLREIGIGHVKDLIFFSRSLMSRSCLLASLQFLTSFSLHRDQSVLEQLDVTTLGKIPESGNAESSVELDSLRLALLPRHEVAVRSSWMSDRSFEKEKKQRKKLADDIRDLSEKFSHALAHAKWWHRDVRVPQQAENSLVSQSSSGDDKTTKIPKVKVQSGATPSCNRTAMEGPRGQPDLLETLSQRQEAREILQRRCDDLNRRHAASVRATYLRYADKAMT